MLQCDRQRFISIEAPTVARFAKWTALCHTHMIPKTKVGIGAIDAVFAERGSTAGGLRRSIEHNRRGSILASPKGEQERIYTKLDAEVSQNR